MAQNKMVEFFSFLSGFLTEYLKAKKVSLNIAFVIGTFLFSSVFFGWVLFNDNPESKGLVVGFGLSLGFGLFVSCLIVMGIKFGKK